MNEKVVNLIFMVVLGIAVFFLINQCSKAPDMDKRVYQELDAPKNFAEGRNFADMKNAKSIVLGSVSDPKYKLAVTVSSDMAGVQMVQLNRSDYAEKPNRKDPLTLMQAAPGTLKPFSVTRVKLPDLKMWNGTVVEYRDGLYHWNWEILPPAITDMDGEVVKSVTLKREFKYEGDTKKAATVYRTYALKENSYDVDIVTKVVNDTGAATSILVDQLGSVNLPNDALNMPSAYVQVAKYLAAGKGKVEGETAHLMDAAVVGESFKKGESGSSVRMVDLGRIAAPAPAGQAADRVVWTAQGNRFFAAIVRPEASRDPAAPAKGTRLPMEIGAELYACDWISSVVAAPLAAEMKPEEAPVGIYYPGAAVSYAAGQSLELPLKAYFGPKKASLLVGDATKPADSEEYVKKFMNYERVIKYSQGGPCGACTFDWLVKPILKLLDWIYIVVRNYGVAILILTIVVRLLLHPLTRMGQTQMAIMQKKMGAIQPEIERVKKRYEKDRKTQQMEIMKVYRENNVNPAGGIFGCLPMLLQTPIWIALYAGLATAIELRHAPFIPGWVNDLSNPDTVYKIPTSFNVWIFGLKEGNQHYLPVNILPIVLGVLFWFQMKLNMSATPKPADPQQAQTQKISMYMILLFPLFLYNGPSGLNLYMVASTIGGMLDTWLIRKSLRAKGILPAANPSPM